MDIMRNQKFIIQPHFRLQEWVAEEKGYFKDEGLDYEFREEVQATGGKIHDKGDKVGAYQSFEEGRKSDVSCACHWTVNVAATSGHGKLYADLYSVAPSGIFVPADSPVKTPEDLAGVPISVGFQSGSHYATIQALEQYMPADKINLSFNDGMLFSRMELLLEGKLPACALFSGPYYFAEQLGFRKIIDNTFMITTMITGNPDPEDLRKFFHALRRAQRDIDLRPELYTHYYKNEIPDALPRHDGHAALGAGRAHRVRALLARGVRGVAQVDRRPRHLRRHRHGRRAVRRRDRHAGGVNSLVRSSPLAGEGGERREPASRDERAHPTASCASSTRRTSGADLSAQCGEGADADAGSTPTTPGSRSARPSPARRTSPTRCWRGSRPRRRTSQSRSRCRR